MKWFAHTAAAYAIGLVVTFGHCAANMNVPESLNDAPGFRAVSGLLAGIAWPLYWSWWVFEK